MNGDSLVREVILLVLMSVLLLRSLLMLLEVDEMEMCNCGKGLNSIAIFVMVEID